MEHKSFVCTQFKCQTVLFDPEIGPYQVLLLWARVDLGTMAMLGVLHIPRSSNITGASPSDFLMLYPGQLLAGCLNPLQRYSQCILQPGLTRLGVSVCVCVYIYIYIYIYISDESADRFFGAQGPQYLFSQVYLFWSIKKFSLQIISP